MARKNVDTEKVFESLTLNETASEAKLTMSLLRKAYSLVCIPKGTKEAVRTIDETVKNTVDGIKTEQSEESMKNAIEALTRARDFIHTLLEIALKRGTIVEHIGVHRGYHPKGNWIIRGRERQRKHVSMDSSDAQELLDALHSMRDALRERVFDIQNLLTMNRVARAIDAEMLTKEALAIPDHSLILGDASGESYDTQHVFGELQSAAEHAATYRAFLESIPGPVRNIELNTIFCAVREKMIDGYSDPKEKEAWIDRAKALLIVRDYLDNALHGDYLSTYSLRTKYGMKFPSSFVMTDFRIILKREGYVQQRKKDMPKGKDALFRVEKIGS